MSKSKLQKSKGTNYSLIDRLSNPALPATDTIIFMIAFSVIARLLLTLIKSYEGDIAGYVWWATDLFENGPVNFYIRDDHHIVYAPFYLYILWFLGGIMKFLSTYSAKVYLVKLSSDLFDFFGAYLIYRIAKKHNKEGLGFFLSVGYILNPGVFFNSSIWGQFDGPQAVLQLLSIYILDTGRKSLGLMAFAIAVLTKPQSAILAPIVLLYFIKDIQTFDKKAILDNLKKFAIGIFYSIIVYTVLVLPFYYTTKLYDTLSSKFGSIMGRVADFYLWMYSLYSISVDDYPYATANAFNFWTLMGGQAPVTDTETFISILGIALTYKAAGLIIFGLCVILSAVYFYTGRKNPQTPYFSSYFVILAGFFFATRMHERYLLPSIIFLTISVLWNIRNIATLVLLSIAVTANHWHLYNLSFKKEYWINNYDSIGVFFALITAIVVIISFVYITNSINKKEGV